MNDYELAAILGCGQKVRYITMAGTESFISHHVKEDAAEAIATALMAITNAGGPEAAVTMARYKPELHGHEEDPDGPQPKHTPYPTLKSSTTGM